MKLPGKILAATALIAFAGPALAADIVVVPPPAPAPVPLAEPNFVGPYWGVYGGVGTGGRRGGGGIGPAVGTQFGYNIDASSTLRLGIEVETEHFVPGFPLVDATLNGRIGLVLGGNNNILVYGQAGIGTLVFALPTWSAGGGVELLLNNGLALFAEGKAFFLLGAGSPLVGWSVRGGVNYYADRENLDAAGDFDWAGMYLGAFLGVTTAFVAAPPPPTGLGGVQVGYNFGGNPFLVGVEVETTHNFPFPVALVQALLNGRVGLALGNFLIYGEAGIGTASGTNPVYTAGGGVEIALGERLGVFAEAEAVFGFGGGGLAGYQATGGINVHFGR